MRLGVVALMPLLVLAACATPRNTRYYTLSGDGAAVAKEASGAAVNRVAEFRVAIGPVTVPDALDRLQLVLSVSPNRHMISDAENWSVPLKREIPRVVAEVVGLRLPAAHVTAYTQHGGQGADYRVLIDVRRFESVPGDSITLEAVWTVRNSGGERLREARSVFVERVNAPGVEPLVRAHGKALAALGQEIAEAVGALASAKR